MGEKEGLPSIAVRIGAFQPHSTAQSKNAISMMDAWISERDCLQLLERCIDASENIKFAIVHGLSRNTFNRMEIESTRQLLGYDPQDNFFEESEVFKKINMSDELAEHNVTYVENRRNFYIFIRFLFLDIINKNLVYEINHQMRRKKIKRNR